MNDRGHGLRLGHAGPHLRQRPHRGAGRPMHLHPRRHRGALSARRGRAYLHRARREEVVVEMCAEHAPEDVPAPPTTEQADLMEVKR
jgi:hypothetical protein